MANEEVVAYDSVTELNEVPTEEKHDGAPLFDDLSEMKHPEEIKLDQETKQKMVMTKEELKAAGLQQLPVDENGNPIVPTDIWLQFNTLSVGVGENRHTFDLVKILEGLTRLAEVTIIRQEAPVEDATDDIEEVKQECKDFENGQPSAPKCE